MFATLLKRVEHGSELTRETAAAALFLSRGELELSRLTDLWTVAGSLVIIDYNRMHRRSTQRLLFCQLINTFLYLFIVLAMLGYI